MEQNRPGHSSEIAIYKARSVFLRQLLSTVSHSLGRSLIGFHNRLKRLETDNLCSVPELSSLIKETEAMEGTLQGLLELTSMSIEPIPCSISGLIATALLCVEHEIYLYDVSLKIAIIQDCDFLLAPGEIVLALATVLSNAVSVCRHQEERKVTVNAEKRGKTLWFLIQDTGAEPKLSALEDTDIDPITSVADEQSVFWLMRGVADAIEIRKMEPGKEVDIIFRLA